MAYGWWDAFGDIGTAIINRNTMRGDTKKGLAYFKELGEREKALNQFGQEAANTQRWNDYNQKYLGIKNRYEAAITDEERNKIAAESHSFRDQATAAGINLMGEDLSANDMRVGLFDEGQKRVAGLTQGLSNAGYKQAGLFAPQSDMGRDAGATAQPASFDFGNSMTGINNLIGQERGLFQDPNALKLKMLTDITKMDLSPGAMAKISPLVDSHIDSQKQSQLKDLIGQLAQVGNNREAARPILLEMARIGVNVPAHLLPDKPDWRFSTAPDGSLIRADGNTGQAAVIGNFSKPEADWLTGFAPDGTPYKVNRKTGEVVYGQKGQYAKPPRTGSVKDNAAAAAQQVAKNHNDWLRANKEAIAMKTLKESDSPWYKYLNAAQESIARSGGFNTDQQPQGSGTITDDEYNQLYNKLVFDYKMTPEQAQEYIQQHYW
ncbi:hypothetical protein KL86SPO_50179 [uncultured Sporomusa sp.]|uniref:Uncharacterized protein n=1 Tax=uncultured Sporomusa sp. TaxID=307249 RepID=A0A212LXZ8_9FIRM|nr:hypothetical protein [uncultured Sporomusa sp.]SCM82408.1 hypothetical protein KL86SPO_50179 [uncultured Sporomusa sp.]